MTNVKNEMKNNPTKLLVPEKFNISEPYFYRSNMKNKIFYLFVWNLKFFSQDNFSNLVKDFFDQKSKIHDKKSTILSESFVIILSLSSRNNKNRGPAQQVGPYAFRS